MGVYGKNPNLTSEDLARLEEMLGLNQPVHVQYLNWLGQVARGVLGEGRLDDKGQRVPMQVRAGDTVLFAKYGGTEYRVDDVEYLILSEKDILGIIQSE